VQKADNRRDRLQLMKWIALIVVLVAVAAGSFTAGYRWADTEQQATAGSCDVLGPVQDNGIFPLMCSSEQAVEQYEEKHDTTCVLSGGLGGRGMYACRK
jgi:hypothetical protein